MDLAARFEQDRTHLRAVAYRMLGAASEADDAVQHAWLRVSHADTGEVANLTGWLTTVVARVCLSMLHSRPVAPGGAADRPGGGQSRPGAGGGAGRFGRARSARRARHADPAERLAFVLHDLFAMPFDDIAPIVVP